MTSYCRKRGRVGTSGESRNIQSHLNTTRHNGELALTFILDSGVKEHLVRRDLETLMRNVEKVRNTIDLAANDKMMTA